MVCLWPGLLSFNGLLSVQASRSRAWIRFFLLLPDFQLPGTVWHFDVGARWYTAPICNVASDDASMVTSFAFLALLRLRAACHP